jgi:hypothetical protein
MYTYDLAGMTTSVALAVLSPVGKTGHDRAVATDTFSPHPASLHPADRLYGPDCASTLSPRSAASASRQSAKIMA